MLDLHVSWDEYHQSIELLAKQIYQSQWEFDRIICLARGGLRVGDILSRIFKKPLAILAASSYGGDRERGKLSIASQITMTDPSMGSRVLVVDDLVDSGVTLQQTTVWLRDLYPEIEELKTAVIWYKACSLYIPDYYVSYLPSNPWIHQPFEKYDNFDILTMLKQR
ncbi:phosphoribosyltransferase [Chamaesiphon minutus]|uniref:Putative phosphoribosyltransferase n=1 Tax=Chamaesiphon minutus (strain ATCC 27169 / PCC 6605) TaxID=1173020 RepID=K9U8H3_CHAP6|nr:phosphoribosyltransferase [Chamaesiphon minutus]AFY91362.1 putative phosphoribosyltransferase [Chamaesiphon minutus PCC 6605]